MANVRWQFILQESMLLPKGEILTSRCGIFTCIKSSVICRQESLLKWELSSKQGFDWKFKKIDKMTKANIQMLIWPIQLSSWLIRIRQYDSCPLMGIYLSFLYWFIVCKDTISNSLQASQVKKTVHLHRMKA